MIVIKVELWPHGFELAKKSLGEAHIWNVGGDRNIGEYKFALYKAGNKRAIYREGRLKGFPRLRLLAWDLLYRVLDQAVGDRNRSSKAQEISQ